MLPRALRTGGPAAAREFLARRFGVDARALAALRVSLGLLLLADLLGRSRNLVAHYTDAGVLPRAALGSRYPVVSRLSIHAVSGEARVQALLFLVAGGFALALLVGYRTRLAAVGSLVLLVSLHLRNPLVLNGGDALLRRLLFWGCFLPLGERWAVDALRGEPADGGSVLPRRRVTTLASAGLLCQVVVIYVVNAVYKLRSDVWLSGEAIRYVFSLDQLTVGLGNALAGHPAVLRLFARVWLAMVVCSVLLVLLTGRARTAFVGAFVAMHLGMAATMRLGLFPLVSVAALLPFLPPSVWDRVAPRSASLARWDDRLGAAGSLGTGPTASPNAGPPGPPGRVPGDAGLPAATGRVRRRLGRRVVAVPLAFVLVWNAAALGYVPVPEDAGLPVEPGDYAWDMFAPAPRGDDGRFVVPARLESGGRVDAFHRKPVEWDRPPDYAATFPDQRWFLYLLDLSRSRYAGLRVQFADYLCRRWNTTHDDDLTELTVYYVEQPTRLDDPEPIHRRELLTHRCSGGG